MPLSVSSETKLLVEIALRDGEAPPAAALAARVYDEGGALTATHPLASSQLPGVLAIVGLPRAISASASSSPTEPVSSAESRWRCTVA